MFHEHSIAQNMKQKEPLLFCPDWQKKLSGLRMNIREFMTTYSAFIKLCYIGQHQRISWLTVRTFNLHAIKKAFFHLRQSAKQYLAEKPVATDAV
ncbi:hypothetical protein [Gynuella sp.]|uniref:hypothetical protein n=1 Tax=Gynuella sp. TaxID=2969146 RepID=UPI003D0AE087